MILTDYFDPISLDKPEDDILLNQQLFCKHIDIYTPNNPIANLSSFQVAIIGIPEHRGNKYKSVALAPDTIRNSLYQLNFIDKKIKIADLGNLKIGTNIKDTYYGLRDVILELSGYNIISIILGGTQDISYGMFLAMEYLNKPYTFTTVDYRIDVAFETFDKITHKNYLNSIILENNNLFEYINISHQACFSNAENFDLFENLFYESIRLGLIRNKPMVCEPYIRDSDMLSIDFSSVKHSDAPGQITSSPNGLNAEDICQLARYSGFSEKMKIFGLFDINPEFDHNNVTSALAAQTLWYFLEGFSIRANEFPELNPDQFKKYIVSYNEENNITFYRSLLTERWWFEVPGNENKTQIFSCSEADYLMASKNEIPDRWLKFFKKLN